MSDAQLDTIIEKLDKIIEQIMLGGVTAPAVYRPGPDLESVKGMTRETLEMRDTDVVPGRACFVCGAHHHSGGEGAPGVPVATSDAMEVGDEHSPDEGGPAGGRAGQFPGLRDTPVSDDDEVARWSLPGDHHLTLEVTKRHGVVIDVQILPS